MATKCKALLNIIFGLTILNLVLSESFHKTPEDDVDLEKINKTMIIKMMDKIDKLEHEVAGLKQSSEDSSRGKCNLLLFRFGIQ